MASSPDKPDILQVQILEAFAIPRPERAMYRFLRYSEPVRCAECQEEHHLMLTMLCTFKIDPSTRPAFLAETIHPPLTPVCPSHKLIPAPATPSSPSPHNRRVSSTEFGLICLILLIPYIYTCIL